ncbi:uncharacterized protein LOC134834091 isoform X2 [Culicoides brevitarsis]|uniref:uncharacterized protein LOC134834091 isoform X2 n=1 Tax=Culicoides brevitarsis TaxID=469753 RepID=UPI00307C8194
MNKSDEEYGKSASQTIMEIATDDSFMLICFISIVAMGIMITLIGNCLCCRRNKAQKVTNAPHRSLPDLPAEIGDTAMDNNSDLYATVGDKMQQKAPEKSPSTLKKQTSISQHSSISQADDFSSPYARVRSPPHAYDKVKRAEHPYAQVGSQMLQDQSLDETDGENSPSQRQSNGNLPETEDNRQDSIPAASAIAGRVSASQDLPYMTPPIHPPQLHFSGDSQDSSKGYTSISVREPLANIIAMTNEQNAQRKRREMSDSHYATVSDDSDEMYAAIDDPNHVDLYTSGSETYAQIQPPSQMTVSVEINATNQVVPQSQDVPASSTTTREAQITQNSSQNDAVVVQVNPTPVPPSIDSLKTHMHSRQASASSCSSSLGYIIGSPKPEKRQANSPLPPTPKSLHKTSSSNLTSGSSNVTSGRNSAASVIEVSNVVGIGKMETPKHDTKKKSPSKDIEGMYAKVMKKTKLFTNLPENNGNVPEMYVSDPDITKEMNIDFDKHETASPGKSSVTSDNNYETIDKKKRNRTGSFTQRDPGYETIPAEKHRKSDLKQNARMSAPVGSLTTTKIEIQEEPGYEILLQPSTVAVDPGYEILKQANNSDYDPNYEVLRPVDDGYARIMDKYRSQNDEDDDLGVSPLDGYAKIGEKKQTNINNNVVVAPVDDDATSNLYSSLTNPPYASLNEVKSNSIAQNTATPSTESFTSSENNLLRPCDASSLTGSDTDPNYESVRYLKVTENPYERLHSEKTSPVSVESGEKSENAQKNVSDFFQV